VNALILATFAELSQAQPDTEINRRSGTHHSDTNSSEMWAAGRWRFDGWPKSTNSGGFQPWTVMILALFFNYLQPRQIGETDALYKHVEHNERQQAGKL